MCKVFKKGLVFENIKGGWVVVEAVILLEIIVEILIVESTMFDVCVVLIECDVFDCLEVTSTGVDGDGADENITGCGWAAVDGVAVKLAVVESVITAADVDDDTVVGGFRLDVVGVPVTEDTVEDIKATGIVALESFAEDTVVVCNVVGLPASKDVLVVFNTDRKEKDERSIKGCFGVKSGTDVDGVKASSLMEWTISSFEVKDMVVEDDTNVSSNGVVCLTDTLSSFRGRFGNCLNR